MSATVFYSSSGGRSGWRLRYYANQNRRTMWIGDVSKAEVEIWRKHVSHIIDCRAAQEPPSKSTMDWLATLPLRQREKLERAELVAPNEASRERSRRKDNSPPEQLGPFLDWYLANRTAKPRTMVKWRHGRDCLLRFFKPTRKLDSITFAEAEAWRDWLAKFGNVREGRERVGKDNKKTRGRTDLSEATVRRRTGQARQFFNYAIKAKLIDTNPFADLPATVHGNDERKFFVTPEMAQQILDNAPGAEWEAIIALARYGGLRAPSEVMRLKWEDIDFANHKMCIHAAKTEHHRNKGIRYCPIFPELLPYLENLAELARHRGAKPTDYVITKPRGSESVLTKPFRNILKRAGLPQYPKPLQNLRASRETELMDEFPIKDVCSWIGNTPKVAMEHYAMTREESFARAAGLVHQNCGPDGGPVNGNSGHLPANSETEPAPAERPFPQSKQGKIAVLAPAGDDGQNEGNRPGRT